MVGNHLADSFRPDWPAYVDDYVQAVGRVGVTFFFLLSGFVLTWSSSTRDGTARFYQRRVARIVPAYLVTWALGLGLVVLEGGRPGLLDAVLGTILLQAWHPDAGVYFGGNGVAWSLSVETLFYAVHPFVLPFLVRLDRRRRLGALTALVAITLAWGGLHAALGNSGMSWEVAILPVVRVPGFLCGVLLALHLRDGGRVPLRAGPATALVAGASLLLPLVPSALQIEALLLVPFVLLLLALAQSDLDGRSGVMAGRAAVRLGEWSFALYLVHELVFRTVRLRVDLPALDPPVAVAAAMAMAAAAVAAAAFLYTVVERPAERALRDIGRTRPTPVVEGS